MCNNNHTHNHNHNNTNCVLKMWHELWLSFFADPDYAAVLDDLVVHAATGGRSAADAAGYKELRQKARAALAALEDAEVECGTPEQRELATLAVASEAAKAALGPKMAGKADAKTALAETKAALEALPDGTTLQHRTRVRHAVAELERELRAAEDDLAGAEAMYNETVRPLVSAKTSTKLVGIAASFDEEFAQLGTAAVADMVCAAEELVNVGAVAAGAIVHVDVGGAFARAQVVRKRPAVAAAGRPGGDSLGEDCPEAYDVLVEGETARLDLEHTKTFRTPVSKPRPGTHVCRGALIAHAHARAPACRRPAR